MITDGKRLAMGIDFGTSNSSVALYDGRRALGVRFPTDNGSVVPTALYIRRQRSVPRVGQMAINTYLRDNEGRLVALTREHLGELDLTSEMTFTFQIHGLTDKAMPGRLLRSLKRWLGDARIPSLEVFGVHYRLVALITPILQHLIGPNRTRANAGVYLGRPVEFAGENEVAEQRLAEAAQHAGLPQVAFYPEPTAAAVSYVHGRTLGAGRVLLCFDFGGGTLDLCVLRAGPSGRFSILATHGIVLGGDLIDQLIYRRKLFPELGEGCSCHERDIRGRQRTYRFNLIPYEYELLNWQLAYKLNRPSMLEPIVAELRKGGPSTAPLQRLYTIIRKNLSYRILNAIEQAKIRLTDVHATTIRVPSIELDVPFTRAELEGYLTEYLADITRAVDHVLDAARLAASDLTDIVCTGGSSRIPAVRQRLEEIIGKPVVEHQTFTGVATGLAIARYHNVPARAGIPSECPEPSECENLRSAAL